LRSFLVVRVSSHKIKSTSFNVSIALWEMSFKFPIGVETMYSLAISIIKSKNAFLGKEKAQKSILKNYFLKSLTNSVMAAVMGTERIIPKIPASLAPISIAIIMTIGLRPTVFFITCGKMT